MAARAALCSRRVYSVLAAYAHGEPVNANTALEDATDRLDELTAIAAKYLNRE
jgi:hypothetical protein